MILYDKMRCSSRRSFSVFVFGVFSSSSALLFPFLESAGGSISLIIAGILFQAF